MRQVQPRIAAVLVASLLLFGCGGGGSGSGPANGPRVPESFTMTPQDTGDGWSISSAAAEGIDANALLAAFTDIRDGDYPGVDSMVVVRHGRLVAEGYFNGFGRDSLHDLRSTGKSFTSALAGFAIEQGLISLDDPISLHLPQFESSDNLDARKRAITIRHLLHMSSGLECNDWDAASPGNEERMYRQRDWVQFILDLPMVREPGSAASYCTGGVVVLGDIIARRSGMALDQYAATWLFAPLGIQQSRWRRSPDAQATGGGGLWLTPRDAAKFGTTYLGDGTWNGMRVIPAAWVQLSRQRVTSMAGDGYGFLWWKRTFSHHGTAAECFFTSGNGGNFIFVLPALELVVVFTGSNYNSPRMDQPFDILQWRVLAAVQ